MSSQSNGASDLLVLIALGAVGYFAWQQGWISNFVGGLDDKINPSSPSAPATSGASGSAAAPSATSAINGGSSNWYNL